VCTNFSRFALDVKHISVTGSEGFATSLQNASYADYSDVVKFIFNQETFLFFLEIAEQLETEALLVFSPEWHLVKVPDLPDYVDRLIEFHKKFKKRVAFQLQLHKLIGVK
jgi:hypothetical protein